MTGKPIYDLRTGQCKFAISPDGAREHLVCAEPVEYEGCPYCPRHAARCFDRRSSERKRADAQRMAVAAAARKAENASRAGLRTISRRNPNVLEDSFDGRES